MLKYKVGNLITAAKEGEVDVIAHQANCQNVMGSGIAPQIKKHFPEAWEADCSLSEFLSPENKLGSYSVGLSGELLIFNLYGQFGYGRSGVDTDYDALEKAMQRMSTLLIMHESGKIGLPKLGAGLGGGDWSIIEEIIEDTLISEGYDVTVYVLNEKEIPEGRTVV